MDEPNQFSNGSVQSRKIAFAVFGILTLFVIIGIVLLSVVLNKPNGRKENEKKEIGESIPSQSMGSSFVVLEATSGRVLNGYRIHAKMEPASTTKILTAICILENMDINAVVEIPKVATLVEGSSIYLKEGEKWKVSDLLYGLMLRSGNDSAETLAYYMGGKEEFSKIMNLTAIKAGAYNSNFTNPHGLHDENHYTTAYDLARITAYAYENEEFVKIVSCQKHYYDYAGERRCFLNKNKMLALYDGANGVKTGYTKDSGRCLVTGAKRNQMQLISVVLNEPNMWQKSADVLEKAFSEYSLTKLFGADEVKELKVGENELKVHVKRDLYYPLKESEKNEIKMEYNLLGGVKNPKINTEIGTVSIKLQNRLIFNEKVYTI